MFLVLFIISKILWSSLFKIFVHGCNSWSAASIQGESRPKFLKININNELFEICKNKNIEYESNHLTIHEIVYSPFFWIINPILWIVFNEALVEKVSLETLSYSKFLNSITTRSLSRSLSLNLSPSPLSPPSPLSLSSLSFFWGGVYSQQERICNCAQRYVNRIN